MVLQTGRLNAWHMGDRIGVRGFAVVGADLAGPIRSKTPRNIPFLSRRDAAPAISCEIKAGAGRVLAPCPWTHPLHARDMLDARGSGKGGAG